MKRDQSISLTYQPPRVRMVEAYAESAILGISQTMTTRSWVDELEIDPEDDQYSLDIEF